MTTAAKRAIAGKPPVKERGMVRRILTAAGTVLFYFIAVAAFYNPLDLIGALSLDASVWAGPAHVPLASAITLTCVWLVFAAFLWIPRLWQSGREKWRFHGAEHKVVSAFEQLGPQWQDGIQDAAKEHRRCGTNYFFLLFAIFGLLSVSMLAAGVPEDPRVAAFLFGFPLIDTALVWTLKQPRIGYILSVPGLWLQRINTLEPEDRHLHAAVKAATPVFEDILLEYETGEPSRWDTPGEPVTG